MLHVINLHAQLGELSILRGINLQVNPGEIHVILGPNGSGKSTLGRVLLGDERYDVTDGQILFQEENFLELDPHERAQKGFFLSFQSPPSIDGVSARDLLYSAKKALSGEKISSFKFKKSLEKRLESLHLEKSFGDRELNKGASGGERTKMEMVSLLTLSPQVAFLDEIDSGIDVDALQAIGAGIKEFLKDTQKSLILVSHADKLVKMIDPTHVHVMYQGKIHTSGGKELITQIHKEGFKAVLPERSSGLTVLS